MKKNIFLRQNKFYIGLWIFFHAAIFLPFLLCIFFGQGLCLDSNLFSMLPSSPAAREVLAADELLSRRSGNSFFIFASNADFSKAKEAALASAKRLSLCDDFSFVEAEAPSFSSEEVLSFVHSNRFNLLGKSIIREITSSLEEREAFREESLSKIYGAFSLVPLTNVESDPFMLDDSILQSYISLFSMQKSLLSAKDGVLAAHLDGKWYVAVRGCIKQDRSSLGGKKSPVPLIYRECLALEKDGTSFVFSGTPFHSYKSSLSASKEISVITVLSMCAVLALLFLVFRTFIPIALSFFAVTLSCALAFCATRLFLGKVHLTALVFGTSLIGACIDYSLHFFIHWKEDPSLKSGDEIRKRIFTGLTLSLASTELCYLLLFFAPFELLKQVAVFSFTGILSSFLTAICLFPCLKVPKKKSGFVLPGFCLGKKIRYPLLFILLFSAFTVIFVRQKDLQIKNDISSLYKMSGKLKDDTLLSARLTGETSPAWFIVSGKTADEVLQAEEALSLEEGKAFEGGICTSLFAPSKKAQDESRLAVRSLASDLEGQLSILASAFGIEDEGFVREAAASIKNEFEASSGKYVLPENLEKPFTSLTENLWLGKIEGRYYSVFMPQKILSIEECRSLSKKIPGLSFMNKAQDIGEGLDELSKFIAGTFLLAFALIIVLLKFFYGFKRIFKIILVPLASVASILVTFILSSTRIEFFCMTGTVLVFGLGLDYIIYMTESSVKKRHDGLEMTSVLLSFATTALSFGALAFSSFMPVHIIGLAVFSGLSAAFAATCLLQSD